MVPDRPEMKTKAKSHPATALKYLPWPTAVQGGDVPQKIFWILRITLLVSI